MDYCIGKPGCPPRMILTASESQVRDQVLFGEVSFAQNDIPPAPHVINPEGTRLIAATVDLAAIDAAKWADTRRIRNGLLDNYAWTYRADSPLTAECQSRWLDWSKQLNRITIDFRTPDAVEWPTQPELRYS